MKISIFYLFKNFLDWLFIVSWALYLKEEDIIEASHHPLWIMFARSSIADNYYLRVITYINIKLIKLQFLLRKDIFNHWDINLISFFNCSTMCFIIDDQQTTLKYLKNTEVNLNNILIMIGNFNIRNNNWDPSYLHYSIHVDTIQEVADSFNSELSTPINPVPTQYTDNPQDYNSVIDLMFFWEEVEKSNNYHISSDFCSLSDYAPLLVSIIIKEVVQKIENKLLSRIARKKKNSSMNSETR